MMGMKGGVTTGDFDKALAILAAVGDPKGLSDAILEMKALHAEMMRLRSDTAAAVGQFATDKEAFDKSQAERVAALDARERDIERENEALSARRSMIAREDGALTMSKAAFDDDRKKHEQRVASDLAELDTRRTNATKREAEQNNRQTLLDARSVALDERDAKLAEGEAAYQARIVDLNERLKPILPVA